MVGREVFFQVEHPSVELGRTGLTLEGVWVQGDEGRPALRGIDLEVYSGEILGIAGVSGNGQKLILARELSRKPSVLVAAQPTRGLDVSATEYVHRQLIEQRTKLKTATLLISDDLDEILSLADRIAVIYEGKIMGVVKRNEVSVEELGMMMGGDTYR